MFKINSMITLKAKLSPYTYLLILVISLSGCKNSGNNADEVVAEEGAGAGEEIHVPKDLNWSERMMISEIHRAPEYEARWNYWSYENGILLTACKGVYEETGKDEYFDFIKEYFDRIITEEGEILTYDIKDQNLDKLNTARMLLNIYSKTKEEKYLKAIETLRSQIDSQPRTSDGGFWHKQRYTNQMWLDGLYMAEPFYVQYTTTFDDGEMAEKAYDDIVNQFDLIQKHALDEETKLLYHGWDESKEQKWADKETGTSPHFWSRAMGWYGMAIVDVLDYFPEDHEGHQRMIEYLQQYAEAVAEYQDEESGLWYQVLDQGDREGNYLEASGSSMFVYTLAKAAKRGYIPEEYLEVAEEGYKGIIDNLISVEENGLVNLSQVCAVAGLGGDPYRDGSFEYYVNEAVRANDPKGTAPFIMASLELER